MKFLITGGHGFLGSALANALVAGGHSVRTYDNDSRGSYRRLEGIVPSSERIHGDVRDPFGVADAAGCDAVVHMAAINGTSNFYSRPWEVLEVGLLGVVNVVNACLLNRTPSLYV